MEGQDAVLSTVALLFMAALQKTLGRVLVLAGALAFACWGYLMLNQFWAQRAASRIFQKQLSDATAATEEPDAWPRGNIAASPADIIGQLEIPRINVSVIVLEGSNSSILDVAAGHIQGTAFPGAIGNVGITAHRDSFFRSLQKIRISDAVRIRTVDGIFNYEVENTEMVDPTDIAVLHQTTDAQLTLVTCYPFHYIGAAPKRFIVHARQRK